MRRLLPLAVVTLVVVVVLMAAGFVTMVSLIRSPQAGGSGSCLPTTETADSAGGASAESLSPDQRAIAARIVHLGQQQQVPPRGWQVAIQAGMTESRLSNLSGGDRDSLGVFQMRPSQSWGTPAQVTNVDYAIIKFYAVLRGISGWESQRPGEAAQAVERSGFPDRYHRYEGLAAELVSTVGGQPDPSGCATQPGGGEGGQQALAFAHGQLGRPYVWGATGPDAWDCSSLTQAAWSQANVTVPRVSRQQYDAGQHVPIEQAQPGDLVFWSSNRNPAYIHHVGLYMGNHQVLHAPEPGDTVKISNLWDGGELVPTATRPA